MTIDETYQYVRFLANQAQYSGNIPPNEFNLAIYRAEIEFFSKRYGHPAQYQDGRPVPRVGFQMTEKITDDLKPFITERVLTVSDCRIVYPTDYVHLLGLACVIDNKKREAVKIIDIDKWANRTQSAIVPPSKEAIAMHMADGMQVQPDGIRVHFTYLRLPNRPVWAFTLDANNRPVYDAANSVDSEFPDTTHNEIALMACGYLGINIKDGDLIQYSQYKEATGV